MEHIVNHVGATGKDLNHKIRSLVGVGIPTHLQQALDFTRVMGNNYIHPGQILVDDDLQMAMTLFNCVNLVAEMLITQPRKIDEVYRDLHASQREQVTKRDAP